MSLADSVFGGIPLPLINQWGISIVYIKASQNQTYDPETGVVLGYETEISAKAVISEIQSEEKESFSQQGMVKFIIPASYLGNYYPQTSDSIRYTQGGIQRVAKIVKLIPYRGDKPIMHSVVARVG